MEEKACEAVRLPTIKDVTLELNLRSKELCNNLKRLDAVLFGALVCQDEEEEASCFCMQEFFENSLQNLAEAQEILGKIFDRFGV